MVNTMNNNITREQGEIILGLYLFDNKKTTSINFIKQFTEKFNSFFKTNTNPQNISYMLSFLKKYDTSYSAITETNEDDIFWAIWDYYVVNERKNIIREKYVNFKKNVKDDTEEYYYDESTVFNLLKEKVGLNITQNHKDIPKEKYTDINSVENDKNKRSITVLINALTKANFKCEYSKEHPTFIRKNSEKPYTEGHHLIPLEYQKEFNFNLDVEANVVSLCSNCHNNLHYGKGYEIILEKLYFDRKDRLNKCKIMISYEELLKMYK